MPVSLFTSQVHQGLYSDEELLQLFDDDGDVRQMVRFEQALAVVQGRLGVIPRDAADEIERSLQGLVIEPAQLRAGTQAAGVPVPALIEVLRGAAGDDAGKWLHFGATSQDVVDTAQMLQAKACLNILDARLERLIDALETKSNEHAGQLLAGRTRSQVSTPITLGYRIAQWAHPLIDAAADLPRLRTRSLRLQFGGASGVNSAIAPDGGLVSRALADELGLVDSPSWHVNRSPILALADWLQRVSTALAKLAGDLVLMGRSDIAEVASGTGGGSSTMPQKSNPVQAETILVLAKIATASQAVLASSSDALEERDGTKWPLEWMYLPQMFLAAGTGLNHAQALIDSLRPDADKLTETLTRNPEIMAETASFVLAKAGVPSAEAKRLVAAAAADVQPFASALSKLSPVTIDWQATLDPEHVVEPCRSMSARIFAKRTSSE